MDNKITFVVFRLTRIIRNVRLRHSIEILLNMVQFIFDNLKIVGGTCLENILHTNNLHVSNIYQNSISVTIFLSLLFRLQIN